MMMRSALRHFSIQIQITQNQNPLPLEPILRAKQLFRTAQAVAFDVDSTGLEVY
jgi:hypothetical protein